MAVFQEFVLMRDAVSQGLGHCAPKKPSNVFESHAGFWNHAKGNLMHMRHVIPNLQFGFSSGGFGALDKDGDGQFDQEEFLNLYSHCLANKKLLDKYEQKVAKRFNVVVGRRSRPEA